VFGESMTLSRTDAKSTVSTIFSQIHGAKAAPLPGGVVSSFLLALPFDFPDNAEVDFFVSFRAHTTCIESGETHG
jgi:hypothetical protein